MLIFEKSKTKYNSNRMGKHISIKDYWPNSEAKQALLSFLLVLKCPQRSNEGKEYTHFFSYSSTMLRLKLMFKACNDAYIRNIMSFKLALQM